MSAASVEQTFGSFYPSDGIGDRPLPDNTAFLRQHNIHRWASDEAQLLGRRFRERIDAGERILLLGCLGTSHDSGLALVEASSAGVQPLLNCEEERFSGVKRFCGFPVASAEEVALWLVENGRSSSEVFAVLYAFDTVAEEQSAMRMLLVNGAVNRNSRFQLYEGAHRPRPPLGASGSVDAGNRMFYHSPAMVSVRDALSDALRLPPNTPCVQVPHHLCHAGAAYALSPFSKQPGEATAIACIDGGGDHGAISTFVANDGELTQRGSATRVNSIPNFFLVAAMLLGGWTALDRQGHPRSDNRFMGVASWGDQNRLTNPFYRRLQSYFHYGPDGQVFVNKSMAENDFSGIEEVLGPFFLAMSAEPGFQRCVRDDALHRLTRHRADVAAAVQLVFEDALFHVVAALLDGARTTRLVLCGGGGVNAVANMRLLQHFDRAYFARRDLDGELALWAPPCVEDSGAVLGAAIHFATANGAPPRGRLRSVAICGRPLRQAQVVDALETSPAVESVAVSKTDARVAVVSGMASALAQGAVIGLMQGAAETGGRALGHRSIFADPRSYSVVDRVNGLVKQRDRCRPLSGSFTAEALRSLFDLPRTAGDDLRSYDYMLVSAMVRSQARTLIPALTGPDGACRVQVVREDETPVLHALLKAFGRLTGVEALVNTSLNVASPIAQTPQQALTTLARSAGLDALVIIPEDGPPQIVWPRRRLHPAVAEFAHGLGALSRRVHTRPSSGSPSRAAAETAPA